MFNIKVKHWGSVNDLDRLCVLQSDFVFQRADAARKRASEIEWK